MKIYTILLLICLILILILIAGCYDGAIMLNATSQGDCMVKCKDLMNSHHYHCFESYVNYGTIIENNKLINNSCECILFDCFKEVK